MNGFDKLERLQLDNNIIEKIDGLDVLVNLTWLDLSFNKIAKIEGLNSLLNLTDLSLYQNRIQKVENMDSLMNLNYFSIGNNDISQDTTVLNYLQKFKCLQVLIVQGNPFIKNDGESEEKLKIIAHLPQLKYFDYMMIDEETLKQAQLKHPQEFKYAEDHLGGKAEMTQESILKSKEEANIAKLDKFSERLKDAEFKKLEPMQKQGEFWAKFEDELKEELSSYEENMKLLAKNRKETMDVCENILHEEEKEVETKIIKSIDEFKHQKKHMIREYSSEKNAATESEGLKKQLKQLEAEVMRIEMDHFDLAWNQINHKFNGAIEAITNNMGTITNNLYSLTYHNSE